MFDASSNLTVFFYFVSRPLSLHCFFSVMRSLVGPDGVAVTSRMFFRTVRLVLHPSGMLTWVYLYLAVDLSLSLRGLCVGSMSPTTAVFSNMLFSVRGSSSVSST